MIDAASRELRERLNTLLQRERLEPAGAISHLDTPRRLAVLASGIPRSQPDITEQVNGPSAQIAYKDGQPTPAAHAFAKKVGVDVGKLERVSTSKGEYLAATVTCRGRTAAEILAETLPKEISSLYWPKNMYWRKRGEVFVRPVRWLVAMLDEQVVPLELFGLHAGKISRGHRIIFGESGSGLVAISKPSAYVDALRAAKVLGAAERENVTRKALDAATRTITGARWREDKPLVATVVNLTEFPSAILGSFDPEFLDLPEEVLVTVMRDHQKYFAIEDANSVTDLMAHDLRAVLGLVAGQRPAEVVDGVGVAVVQRRERGLVALLGGDHQSGVVHRAPDRTGASRPAWGCPPQVGVRLRRARRPAWPSVRPLRSDCGRPARPRR